MHAHVHSNKCYESHPALDVGGGNLIYGGSCSNPIVTDADIYVGLDGSMTPTVKAYPWVTGDEVYYRITDGMGPKDVPNFKQMVVWISDQIDLGKKVHVGCIGGHGRTGLVLAAVVAYRKHNANPIAYVREKYCVKAVESREQVHFLRDHYDCPVVKPSRQVLSSTKATYHQDKWPDVYKGPKSNSHRPEKVDSGTPVRGSETLWSSTVTMR
jgi:hypothetical protein